MQMKDAAAVCVCVAVCIVAEQQVMGAAGNERS